MIGLGGTLCVIDSEMYRYCAITDQSIRQYKSVNYTLYSELNDRTGWDSICVIDSEMYRYSAMTDQSIHQYKSVITPRKLGQG